MSYNASWVGYIGAHRAVSEVFPLSMRGKGVALSTASNWLNNCSYPPFVIRYPSELTLPTTVLIGLITPPLLDYSPSYVTSRMSFCKRSLFTFYAHPLMMDFLIDSHLVPSPALVFWRTCGPRIVSRRRRECHWRPLMLHLPARPGRETRY